jgi:hypothetical protein
VFVGFDNRVEATQYLKRKSRGFAVLLKLREGRLLQVGKVDLLWSLENTHQLPNCAL